MTIAESRQKRREQFESWIQSFIGKRFGKLTVIGNAGQDRRGYFVARCKCDCGAEINVVKACLLNEKAKSCGCLHAEYMRNFSLHSPRLEFGESAGKAVFAQYTKSAKRRKLNFDLSFEDFKNLTKGKVCFYCKSNPVSRVRTNGYGHYVYNGIDRIDNSRGYSVDNCVPCCRTCNSAKGEKTVEQFKEWILKISKFV